MVQVVFRKDPMRTNGAIMSRVVPRSTVEFEDLLKYMAKGVLVETSDMRVVFDQFAEALRYFLSKGSRVKTSFGTFSLSLRRLGVSSSDENGLAKCTDRTITTDFVGIRLRPTTTFLEDLKLSTAVEVVATPGHQVPLIYKVENLDKKGVLDSGSSGEILHLSGDRLSFSNDDPEVGVFFVSSDKTEVRGVAYRTGTAIVDCKIPALNPGSYSLEVRTRPTNRDVRVGTYQNLINVD